MTNICPCCVSQPFVYLLIGLLLSFQIIRYIRNKLNPQHVVLKLLSNVLFYGISIIIGLIAIFLGLLSSSPSMRQQFFSKLCIQLGKNSQLDEIRCNLVKNLSGRVLEIGPGPGTNFRCWGSNPNIVEWVGVEPNEYFQAEIETQKEKYNITFPTRTVWLSGENIDVAKESFDYVVGTHVLCSVDETEKVLNQISRALKPGGSYLFLEHVAAKQNTPLFFAQMLVDPIFAIIGNGCHFKRTWELLSSESLLPVMRKFTIEMEHFDAPVGLPFMVPHIRGNALKKSPSHSM